MNIKSISEIANNKDVESSGNLKIRLQKKVNDDWVNERVVTDEVVTVPANGYLTLHDGNNNLGENVFRGFDDYDISLRPGSYRIIAEYDTDDRDLEAEWNFVVNKEE
jgi:hypothetical protein